MNRPNEIEVDVTYRSVHCAKCSLYFYFPIYVIEKGSMVFCPLCKVLLLAIKGVKR